MGTLAGIVGRACLPLARSYVRYSPTRRGKRWLWKHFAWRTSEREAVTMFGARLPGSTADVLHRHLYFFGVWEPCLTFRLHSVLRPGDVFLDIGANVGYFSLLASQLVGQTGSVVAVEASPSIFARLETNLRRNGVRNVRAVNVAAGSSKGRVAMFRAPDHNLGRTSIYDKPGFSLEGEVEMQPVDDLLTDVELESLRVVKVDVEGAECAVIDGMQRLLDRAPPDLEVMVEVDPPALAACDRSWDDVLRPFAARGFHAYDLGNDYQLTAYVDRDRQPVAVRIADPPVRQTDVLFSRRDLPAI